MEPYPVQIRIIFAASGSGSITIPSTCICYFFQKISTCCQKILKIMTSLPFMKNGKTKIAVNKSKVFSSFPTRVKLGPQCGSYPYSM